MASFFKKLSASVAQAVASVNEVAASLSLDNLQAQYGDTSGRASIFATLDLTYLTPRLIIMGYPSTPATRVRSRNDAASVALFLGDFHPGGAMVWDLSDEAAGYDTSIFNNQVIRVNFPGQPMPGLGLLLKICASIERWLAADPGNVAVLHCGTGRGRTCAVAACVLAWMREFESAASALAYVCERRQQTLDRLRAAASAPGQGLLSTGVAALDGAMLASASSADSLIAASTLALPPGQLLPASAGDSSGAGASPSATTSAKSKGSSGSNAWGGMTDPVVAMCCPSQRRYVAYWDRLLASSGSCLSASRLILRRLIVNGVPALLVPATAAPLQGEEAKSATAAETEQPPPAAPSPAAPADVQETAAQVASQVAQATRALASVVSSAVASTLEDLRASEALGGSSSARSSRGVRAAPISPAAAVYVAGTSVAEGTPAGADGDAAAALDAGDAGVFKVELGAAVQGDVLLRLAHRRAGGGSISVWTAGLHTGFLDTAVEKDGSGEAAAAPSGFVLRLPRSQLDIAPRVMVGPPEALLLARQGGQSSSAAGDSGTTTSGGGPPLVALPEHAFVEAVFEAVGNAEEKEGAEAASSDASLAADVAAWASRRAPEATCTSSGAGLSTPRSGTGPASIPDLLAAKKASANKAVVSAGAAKKGAAAAPAASGGEGGGGFSSLFGGWGATPSTASAADAAGDMTNSGTGGAAAVLAALAAPFGGAEEGGDSYSLQLHGDDGAAHLGGGGGGGAGGGADLAAADAASLDILAELEQELSGSGEVVAPPTPTVAASPAPPPAPAVVLTAHPVAKVADAPAAGDEDIDEIEKYLNSLK